eukprot:CAMPEP_0177666612 /NCGR_PEP_ID=MMETSP0447-20121125/21678_1 /TAXON_ID=0 /ORGANISM="Stygamoeba regulata, Strain BSH-02190019" /LENGTH=660 /DNA_ID=CAMNT_0019172779 /DNA_START=157 /DNA_END=2139 /DNA_ORIENTATION=-
MPTVNAAAVSDSASSTTTSTTSLTSSTTSDCSLSCTSDFQTSACQSTAPSISACSSASSSPASSLSSSPASCCRNPLLESLECASVCDTEEFDALVEQDRAVEHVRRTDPNQRRAHSSSRTRSTSVSSQASTSNLSSSSSSSSSSSASSVGRPTQRATWSGRETVSNSSQRGRRQPPQTHHSPPSSARSHDPSPVAPFSSSWSEQSIMAHIGTHCEHGDAHTDERSSTTIRSPPRHQHRHSSPANARSGSRSMSSRSRSSSSSRSSRSSSTVRREEATTAAAAATTTTSQSASTSPQPLSLSRTAQVSHSFSSPRTHDEIQSEQHKTSTRASLPPRPFLSSNSLGVLTTTLTHASEVASLSELGITMQPRQAARSSVERTSFSGERLSYSPRGHIGQQALNSSTGSTAAAAAAAVAAGESWVLPGAPNRVSGSGDSWVLPGARGTLSPPLRNRKSGQHSRSSRSPNHAADQWVLPGARGALSPPLRSRKASWRSGFASASASLSVSASGTQMSPRSGGSLLRSPESGSPRRSTAAGEEGDTRVASGSRDPLLIGLRQQFPELDEETLQAGLEACENSMTLCVWWFRSKGWGTAKKAQRKTHDHHSRAKKIPETKDDFFSNVVKDDLMYIPRKGGANDLEEYFRVLEPHQQSAPSWYSESV